MFTDVKKKKPKKFDVTILTQVVIGILDLWNASTYLSISQKILPKSSNSTYRPHRPIVRKIRYIICENCVLFSVYANHIYCHSFCFVEYVKVHQFRSSRQILS